MPVIGSAVIVSVATTPYTFATSAIIEAIFARSATLIAAARQVGAF